jgi:very-short-patch-repair endonuclease
VDGARTEFLAQQGYRVLRFWNNEVITSMEGVLERISEVLGKPHPNPLPERERE